MDNPHSIIDKFHTVRVAVIGDMMLDRYFFGDVRRMSPEAPIPIISIERELDIPGGAANVATNIVSLGGRASMVGVVGADEGGKKLLELLRKEKIDTRSVIRGVKNITSEKMRVIGKNQHIIRIDREEPKELTSANQTLLAGYIRENISKWDIIIISDYAKGGISAKLAQFVIATARAHGKRVVVDTKPINMMNFKGAYLLAPNQEEAFKMAGTTDLEMAGKSIQQATRAHILVTRGANGMSLFDGAKITHIPVRQRDVFDVVGAGDTVMAALALSLASGAQLEAAARIANHAAGIVVTKQGTAKVSRDELRADIL